MARSFLLVASTLIGTLLGCTERTLNDELAEFCENACHRGKQCGRPVGGHDQDTCVQECVPVIEKNRAACEVAFDLLVCLSELPCVDYEEYESVIEEKDLTVLQSGKYPCGDENIAYLNGCH